MGSGWRRVGENLEFTTPWLDQIETDCVGNLGESSERMLFRWMQWKCNKATVKKLSTALYKGGEVDAINFMDP